MRSIHHLRAVPAAGNTTAILVAGVRRQVPHCRDCDDGARMTGLTDIVSRWPRKRQVGISIAQLRG